MGWEMGKFWRIMGFVCCLLLMVGFGLCGAFGVGFVFVSGFQSGSSVPLAFGAIGLMIAFFAGRKAWKLYRSTMNAQSETGDRTK